jgi:hypothetical protein
MSGLAWVLGGCLVFVIVMGVFGDDIFDWLAGEDDE